MYEQMFGGGLPLGVSIAILQRADAEKSYRRMGERDKMRVIEESHRLSTDTHLRNYIERVTMGDIDI